MSGDAHKPAPPPAQEEPRECDLIVCPTCHVRGIEKKQKWFCPRCGRLLQTCCD